MKLNAKLSLPLRAKKKVQDRPLDEYRARPEHLRAAGGAYLVLPYGLIAELTPELQQQLVSLLDTAQRQHPGWAASTVYQVLPWTRVRVEDLDETELAWHGITCDVDPTSASMTYTRGGSPIPAGTVLGHRPAVDTAPVAPGTLPGARPPLLPPTPDGPPAPGLPVLSPQLRSARVARLQTTRERKHALANFAPTIDPAWAQAIAVSDDLWDSDEQWKQLAAQDIELPDPPVTSQRTTSAEPALPVPVTLKKATDPAVSVREPAVSTPQMAQDASAAAAPADDPAVDWEADIAALSADLEDILK